jgi:tripartite-type tricarboxylate transporter receptor subunit TctC
MKSCLRSALFKVLVLCAVFAAGSIFAGSAHAQDSYPSRPIQLVVTTAAGGANDLVARAVAERLAEALGQPVVVENQPAGNGGIAAAQVAKAAPDGHTLMFFVDSTLTINPHLYKNLAYEPFRDFAAVSTVTTQPMVMVVNTAVKANNVEEFLALARANPGKLNYASTGVGTALHIGGELFKLMTKTDIVHVPYRATTAAMADIMGGRVEMILIGQSAARGLMAGGKLKILGIAANQRSSLLPDVPTFSEAGVPGYEVVSSFGLVAPAKTPKNIIDRLTREVKKASTDPRFITAMEPQGMHIVATSPEEMAASLRADSKKWGDVITTTGTTIPQ